MGKNTDNPTCKLCGEAHRIEAGKVCPKFRSKKVIEQPKPKLLAPPVVPKAKKAKVGDGVALTSMVHPKAKRGSKKPPRDISKASIETIPAPPAIVAAIRDKAKKRKVYLADKARERRAADKVGLTLEEYRKTVKA